MSGRTRPCRNWSTPSRNRSAPRWRRSCASWGVGARPRLVLQIGGGRRASWRDWPVARYAELIRLASAKLDAEIFVLGGNDQHPRRDELARCLAGSGARYHDAVGRFSLAESAALLASARALVSTDTGIMHLGFAVGTRVVALIHCNNPFNRVGPHGYGDRHRVVQLPRPAGKLSLAGRCGHGRPLGAGRLRPAAGGLGAVNFPGLDLAWGGSHRLAHALGLIRPWTIDEARAELASGGKVVVVASTALGDSLLTTPLLETLAHHLGRDRVSILVKAPYAPLFRDDPRVHRVFTVRGKYRWEGLAEELRTDPHRIALLANITEPDLIPQLWRAGVRGFLRYRTRWTRYPGWMANRAMLRRPGEPDYATGHAIENNLAMAEALGLAPATHRLAMPHFARDAEGPYRMVVIHPGASRASKRWPVENWARLADALAEKFGVGIALSGDRSEQPLADEMARLMQSKKPANGAGIHTLPLLALLQANSLAFLSGDTGPYHLAVAVGCPTVTLFAPTDRGSSVEACGPHQADPVFHRALQTEKPGDPIATLSFERVLAEAIEVVGRSLARKEAA